MYTRVGHITPMKDCECNVCVGGGQKEEETGKKTIFMLLFVTSKTNTGFSILK